MDFNTLNVIIRRRKAIRRLLKIGKEYEASGFLGLLSRPGNESADASSEENVRKEIPVLRPFEVKLLSIYGRNLSIDELKDILESKTWFSGFTPETGNWMDKYDFIPYSSVSSQMPSSETLEAFKISGDISRTTLGEMTDSFNTPEATEHLANMLSSILAETNCALEIQPTDGSMSSNVIPRIAHQTNDSQPFGNIIRIPQKIYVTKSPREVQGKAENSEIACNKRHDHSPRLINLIVAFLCMQTEVFRFPKFPVLSNPDFLNHFKIMCLESYAEGGSLRIMSYCKKAKLVCSMIIFIYEIIFKSCKYLLCSIFPSYDEKELLKEIYEELQVLKRDIVKRKQMCIKFLIDVDIFLYHDSPLPKTDDCHWTDLQRYRWKLAVTRVELAIQFFDLIIRKI